MKQPELGKRIAELRKSKGLTQDELVEKCNLSVRTLQRIESGEVMPRSYTIKTIFTALDYNIYESSNNVSNKFNNTRLIISNWLGQFYKYVIDLFNLKTNTMKKLMILSIPFLTISIALLFSFSASAKAQSKMEMHKKFNETSSNERFILLFNSGKIDSISMDYLENACMMPDLSPTIIGRKDINEYYTQLYNQGFRFTELKTLSKFISDSIAIDRGVWSVSINSVVIARGTYFIQWHYIDGKWWIENEISKSDISPMHSENIY
jgi:transcriptional regulator with XRE-family HTH domain